MRHAYLLAAIVLSALIAVLALVGGEASAAPARAPFKKIFVVVLENDDYEDAYAQPFMKKLADEGALFEDFRAITHPSYPNYIAMTSGSTHGIDDNGQRTLDVSHLGDLLETKGLDWKVYAEGYPGNCDLRKSKGRYARRHVPFLSYKNVQENPERCARVVNAERLMADVESGRLAEYSLYIPDNFNNGHDTGMRYADRALRKTFGPLLGDARFNEGMLFVVTFDEDDGRHGNRIYTTFWGDSVVPGTRVKARYSLYDLLRTIEDAFGVGTLGRNDERARRITGDLWK
jgi:hypothetical protein